MAGAGVGLLYRHHESAFLGPVLGAARGLARHVVHAIEHDQLILMGKKQIHCARFPAEADSPS